MLSSLRACGFLPGMRTLRSPVPEESLRKPVHLLRHLCRIAAHVIMSSNPHSPAVPHISVVSYHNSFQHLVITTTMFTCPYCNTPGFKEKRYLNQHIKKKRRCRDAELRALQGRDSTEQEAHNSVVRLPTKRKNPDSGEFCPSTEEFSTDFHAGPDEFDADADFPPGVSNFEADDEADEAVGHFAGANSSILEDFANYHDWAMSQFGKKGGFNKQWTNAIKLCSRLRRGKSSLQAYEEIMLWHFEATDSAPEGGKLSQHPDFISRRVLFSHLSRRYNLHGNVNESEVIILPSSGASARMVRNRIEFCLQSLLTDPRIVDDDYLFFDMEDPFSGPPERKGGDRNVMIGDITTGRAMLDAWDDYISNPGKQVLLPIIFYIDGAQLVPRTNHQH